MSKMLATTALIAALGLPAAAETRAMPGPFFDTAAAAVDADLRASEMIGMRVYTTEVELDTWGVDELETDWNDIGEINDILLARNGKTIAVLVDIGGFLGIGEHRVALDLSQLHLVADSDDPGDYFVVLNTTEEALRSAPAFDVDSIGTWAQTPPAQTEAATAATPSDTATAAEVTSVSKAENETGMIQAPATTPAEGYALVEPETLTAEALDGARVYDSNDEWIGEVSQIVVAEDGKIETLVVDVGGFLGIGEKPVGLAYETFKLQQASDTGEVRAHVSSTRDELEAMPEFEK